MHRIKICKILKCPHAQQTITSPRERIGLGLVKTMALYVLQNRVIANDIKKNQIFNLNNSVQI